ncbi:MAG TPA: DUF190 domain-containing protein [Chthoniobacterales bacterium]|nr:DUF190 domain-containing protein [Chthoniobacterales bacterium]
MLLRIYIGESDRWEHQALFGAIVMRARERQLAGATVRPTTSRARPSNDLKRT